MILALADRTKSTSAAMERHELGCRGALSTIEVGAYQTDPNSFMPQANEAARLGNWEMRYAPPATPVHCLLNLRSLSEADTWRAGAVRGLSLHSCKVTGTAIAGHCGDG